VKYLLSEKTKNSEKSDENELIMANDVAGIGRDQLMVQARRVESCWVANAQTLFRKKYS